ncbi:MAG: hypothetical protein HYV07_14005 [Deltaproteobacteria bacterium]|nr:hypothetical protein [Deltaproteobacteria bacterium]
MKVQAPTRCYECGGTVELRSGSGRTMPYRNIAALELPAEIVIPTCASCGEMFMSERLTSEIEDALQDRYEAALRARVLSALDALQLEIPQQELESVLGLSQGYLSKIRKKKTTPMIASLLLLLADDPRSNVERLRKAWAHSPV